LAPWPALRARVCGLDPPLRQVDAKHCCVLIILLDATISGPGIPEEEYAKVDLFPWLAVTHGERYYQLNSAVNFILLAVSMLP